MSDDDGEVAETRLLQCLPLDYYSFRRFRVRVVEGVDKGKEQVSDGPEYSIGTAQGNQLVLSDKSVSRHHSTITVTPHGFLLRDLGSTNGTKLGDYRVDAAYLKPGARIQVGLTTLVFEQAPGEIREPLSPESRHGNIVGISASMRRVLALLPRIAASESTVLLEGETGTGKGLVAEAIHGASRRAKNPLIVVDCGSIPPTLIESELFGHEKGAFTGAHLGRAGAFEAAEGGTVFLDEIAELPLELQPRLLRALEERTTRRIGSTTAVRRDVRVVAATNRDLRQEVNRGAFRSDLFFRLNTVTLRIPPLRERPEDIPLLVAHFYEQFASGEAASAPAELIDALARRSWPGNVRELRNAVERAVLFADCEFAPDEPASESTHAEALPNEDYTVPFRTAKEQVITRWERRYLEGLMARSKGNVSGAARTARMDRNHLRDLLRRHCLVGSEAEPPRSGRGGTEG